MDERINTSRREDVHSFSIATRSAFYQKNKPILKELLEKSVRAKPGDYSLFDIQFELLGHILEAQSVCNKYTHWKVLIRKALKSLVENKSPPERIQQAKLRLKFMQNSLVAAQLLLGQLRSIGDGIAWHFLNYDRATLRFLAEHEYVSVPQRSKGLATEIAKCIELASQNKPFLLNSITNCLRIADITVFDKASSSFELIEVKSSNSQDSRTIRQRAKLLVAQDSIRKSEYTLISDGKPSKYKKTESEKSLLTYAKSLESAMLEAKSKLASSRVFGDYLSFYVFYLKDIVELPEMESHQLSKEIIERCFSIKRNNDVILHFYGNIVHTVHFSRILAPYAIFPISTELRFELMSGDFLVGSYINVDGLARWLRNRGCAIEVLKPPENLPDFSHSPFLPIFRIPKPHTRLAIELPLALVAVAAMELWMPESIERIIKENLTSSYSSNMLEVDLKNTCKYTWD